MDLLRKDTAKQYRGIRKLLHGNPPLDPPPVDYDGWYVGSIGLIFIALLLLIIASCVHPTPGLTDEEVDMTAIATIESSNNPYSYNYDSKATGLYQITPICIKDYNRLNKRKYTIDNMFDFKMSYRVANWCMNTRIPSLLKHYHLEDSIVNRLWAYNAGISFVRRQIMPDETKNYIIKYEDLTEKQ